MTQFHPHTFDSERPDIAERGEPIETHPSEDIGFRANDIGGEPMLAFGGGAIDTSSLPGRLIVIEGTDGVGRSTQAGLLREWLEKQGYGVVHTAQARSQLASDGLRKAKEGHTLGRTTMDLFYATDFAARLEQQVLPALRAGFIVITDRYIFSMLARSIARGGDPQWIEDVYRFAPTPDAVFYLKADIPHLLPRVMTRGGFDYWESGMDFTEEDDIYRSFQRYQKRVLEVFDVLAKSHAFTTIEADQPVADVFAQLRAGVESLITSMRSAGT